MTDPEYISTTEAARRLGVSRPWVTVLINRGELEGYKINPRAWLVSLASVERLQAARSTAAHKNPGKST